MDISVSRRGFLKLMGASLAMAGMTACTKQPLEPIVPYVKQPEELIPGRPLFYASAFTLGGYATPVLVESQMAPGDFVRNCKLLVDLLKQIEDVAPKPASELAHEARGSVSRGVVAYTGV